MDHLKQLCEDLHIDSDLKKNEQGFFPLSLNDSLSIYIKPQDPGTMLQAELAPMPKQKKEELLTYLMKANLFGQGTMGSVIGLIPQQNLLTLSINLPYDMNYRLFREQLEDFANVVDYWRAEIKQHNEKANNGII